MSVLFPLFSNLLLLSSALAQEDAESSTQEDAELSVQETIESSAQEESSSSLEDLFAEQKWSEIDAAMQEKKSATIQEWLMGAKAALELGDLQHAHQRYKSASILDSKIGCPIECRIIREETANVKINGEGALLFDEQAPYYLLRAIDKANDTLSHEQFFSGRLPIGLYAFASGGVLVSTAGAEILTAEQYKEALSKQAEYQDSFAGQFYSVLKPWKYAPTVVKMRAGLHTHYFGSENSDISMQSVWSYGPTAGIIWRKNHDVWTLGAEANGYLSFSTRSFLLGFHGDAFGEYTLPKGFVSAGVRYDLSLGRIVGVQSKQQVGTITEEELDALAIPGVALSLGGWIGYRYPIRENIDIQTRIGFRHDGKRGYFDTDVGAVFDIPF